MWNRKFRLPKASQVGFTCLTSQQSCGVNALSAVADATTLFECSLQPTPCSLVWLRAVTMTKKKTPRGAGYTVRVGGRKYLTASLLEEQVEAAQQQLT
jgi:hypothetical protein